MEDKILIIEDDNEMAAIFSGIVAELGYTSERSSDGADGLNRAAGGHYALVILDLGLPKLDGFDVCRELRNRKPDAPILIVSSRALEGDRVIGLELGADDYLVKPFGAYELRARIRAVLRRSERAVRLPVTVEAGPIQIDTTARLVSIQGKPVALTALEFDLLAHFASAPGKVFTRDELMHSVWGYDATSFGPSITAQISRLRNKIEPDPERPRFLVTVRGVGYRLSC